jgi:hypothetical protein
MTDRRSRVIRDCVQGVAENKEGLVCVDLSCWGIGPWLFSDNDVIPYTLSSASSGSVNLKYC